ncbi:hypothetical protein QR680_005288 [Steinernema hermaphroditum]|uniref:Uncharacterized protein n=1 Tax=Steinernema hermaphroditum TaxID=289476 RepID=A0AA39HSP2_9BILA|nr:hypothetical protein QR680_005288 [Steinernema hermaphroditum]
MAKTTECDRVVRQLDVLPAAGLEKKLRGVQLMPSYENAEEGMQHGEVTGAEEQEWNRRRNETHGEAPPKPIDAQD